MIDKDKINSWYAGTNQCIEANLHQQYLCVIDKEQARKQIMAHIETLVETLLKEREKEVLYGYVDYIFDVGRESFKELADDYLAEKESTHKVII